MDRPTLDECIAWLEWIETWGFPDDIAIAKTSIAALHRLKAVEEALAEAKPLLQTMATNRRKYGPAATKALQVLHMIRATLTETPNDQ